MTDHPIPDDLLDRMAHALIDAPLTDSLSTNNLLGGWGDESAIADLAHAALAALAEWADGALIDPQTWRRLDPGEGLVTDDIVTMGTLTERAEQ